MPNRRTFIPIAGLIVIGLLAFVLLNNSPTCCATETTPTVQDISPDEYQDQFTSVSVAHLLIDVRTPDEFASGHIQGALNIPVESLESRLSEVPSGQPIVVYCRSGNRSATASQILAGEGYTSIYDLGGINAWTAQGFPLE